CCWRFRRAANSSRRSRSGRHARASNMIGSNAPLYENIDSMLNEQKPDLVIVCTPDHTHDDIVVRAMESGIDVITEKP
ncbi:Gfo/Idh/MocA family oxidoreductase, partial [Rhizobium ruizarguesonis]